MQIHPCQPRSPDVIVLIEVYKSAEREREKITPISVAMKQIEFLFVRDQCYTVVVYSLYLDIGTLSDMSLSIHTRT